MDEIVVPAPAKINLALDVKGIRADNFHEVEMIMQSISLHDIITIRKNDRGIALSVSEPALSCGRDNLAYQAAELILKEAGLTTGVDINIEKKIPIAGGLAGGSTDAAAVLKGICRLYELPLNEPLMQQLAAELGSDVPFCLHGGTALATGRGEKIRQLADLAEIQLVLVNPGIKISTAQAYRQIDKLVEKEDIAIHSLVDLIENGKIIYWTEGWKNIFEKIAIQSYQEIKLIKTLLKEMGALFVLMSGSGSTVFAVVEDQTVGQLIIDNWPRENDFLATARTVKKEFPELWRNK